jgi:hypothetical protein
MAKVFKTKKETYEVELYQTSDGQWIPGYKFALAHEKKLEKEEILKKRKEIMGNTRKEEIEGEEFFDFKTQEEAEAWDAPGVGKWVKIYDPDYDAWGDREYEYMKLGRYIDIIENYLDEIKSF